jgi:hypothetical protein
MPTRRPLAAIALTTLFPLLLSAAPPAPPAPPAPIPLIPEDKIEGTPVPVPIALEYVTFIRRSTPLDRVTFPKPPEQLVALYLGRLERTINRVEDLSGLVAIHTPDDALAFTRLLTTDKLWLPESLGREIQPDGTVPGQKGKIPAKTLADAHYLAPHAVRLSDDAWLVSRTILSVHHSAAVINDQWQIDTTLEKIDSSGNYRLLERTPQFTGKIETLPLNVIGEL